MEQLGYALIVAALLLGGGLLWRRWSATRATRALDAGAHERPEDLLDLVLRAGGEELWEYEASRGFRRHGALPVSDRLDARRSADHATFVRAIHPDDRAEVTAAFDRTLLDGAEHTEATYRVRLKSGGWVWLHSRGRVVARDDAGRVLRIVGTTRDVSALKRKEERLLFALEAAGEELWEIDTATGTVRRDNPFGEVANVSSYRATATEMTKVLHPDDVAHVNAAFRASVTGAARTFRAVYRLRRSDGRYLWLDSQGRGLDPDENGRPRQVVGTTRDITEIKQGEERLRLALWGSRAELWDLDMTSGEIVRDGKLEHLAISRDGDRIRFRELLAAVHKDDVKALRVAMVSHAKAETEGFEASFRTRDLAGSWRWALARGRVTERNREGWAMRMLGTMHDVTELKEVEDALRALNDELEQRVARRTGQLSDANAELVRTVEQLREAQRHLVESEKMAALGSLVAGVAHEINTPLGISVTAASHLDESLRAIESQVSTAPAGTAPALETARQSVDLVLRNLRRADQLVKSFKQVAVDQSAETPRSIDVRDYIGEVLVSLQPKLRRRPIRIEVTCPPDLSIRTFAGAVYQLLMNLVVNSAMHGFGEDEPGTIRIDVARCDDAIELVYRDDGRGMPPEVRARVFEPFFTTRRGSGGTGLGMHIAYNLVTQVLRGTIRCDDVGRGVSFTIRFPCQLGAA